MTDDILAAPVTLVGVKGDDVKLKIVEDGWSARQVLAKADLPVNHLLEEEKERHLLYVLLVMSLVYKYWNGYKKGRGGTYHFRDEQLAENSYETYLGHNIAAIAVDADGRIVDFDFNHNEVLRSSIEHAEARLMRRLFNLADLQTTWNLKTDPDPNAGVYTSLLAKTTVYTTAEPCAQCIGIMALAKAKEVVYVQPDDGTMRVANALYNLMPYGARVVPIEAQRVGIPYGAELTAYFGEFANELKTTPFWEQKDTDGNVIQKDNFPSLISFLCTDKARKVFEKAYTDLCKFVTGEQKLKYPDYPEPQNRAEGEKDRLTNKEVLCEVLGFLKYASNLKQRGTSH